MKVTRTDRGFQVAVFKDRYDKACSIQESSLATERCIWLGISEVNGEPARMHLTQQMMIDLLPLLTNFVATGQIEGGI